MSLKSIGQLSPTCVVTRNSIPSELLSGDSKCHLLLLALSKDACCFLFTSSAGIMRCGILSPKMDSILLYVRLYFSICCFMTSSMHPFLGKRPCPLIENQSLVPWWTEWRLVSWIGEVLFNVCSALGSVFPETVISASSIVDAISLNISNAVCGGTLKNSLFWRIRKSVNLSICQWTCVPVSPPRWILRSSLWRISQKAMGRLGYPVLLNEYPPDENSCQSSPNPHENLDSWGYIHSLFPFLSFCCYLKVSVLPCMYCFAKLVKRFNPI